MSSHFILADFVARLNVAARSHMLSVNVCYSDLSLRLLDLFYENGVIDHYVVLGDKVQVFLRYTKGNSVFSSLTLISKPSTRVYWTLSFLDLAYRSSSFGGFYIVSTQNGLFTSHECLLYARMGGEILLKVTL